MALGEELGDINGNLFHLFMKNRNIVHHCSNIVHFYAFKKLVILYY